MKEQNVLLSITAISATISSQFLCMSLPILEDGAELGQLWLFTQCNWMVARIATHGLVKMLTRCRTNECRQIPTLFIFFIICVHVVLHLNNCQSASLTNELVMSEMRRSLCLMLQRNSVFHVEITGDVYSLNPD